MRPAARIASIALLFACTTLAAAADPPHWIGPATDDAPTFRLERTIELDAAVQRAAVRLAADFGTATLLVNGEPALVVDLLYYAFYMLALGVHMAGPNLTPETFRDGLFRWTPIDGQITAARVSWGNETWPEVDYNDQDDATGDEGTGDEGTGDDESPGQGHHLEADEA